MKKRKIIKITFVLFLCTLTVMFTGSKLHSKVKALSITDPCPDCGQYSLVQDPAAYNEPQCWEPAVTVSFDCSNCGYHYEETIEPKAHNYVISDDESYPATCTTDGQNVYYCTNMTYTGGNCNDKKVENLPATNHKNAYLVNASSATCTTDGYTGDTYCPDCKTTVATGSTIKATGHQNTELLNVKAATCTASGYTGDTYCNDCKTTVATGKTISATGHQNTVLLNIKSATCTADGYTGDTYCNDCKTTVATGKTIKALGHNYSYTKMEWSGYTAKAVYTCKNDSSHVERYAATVTNKVTVEPTCETAGTRTYTASYDGHTDTKTESVKATGHSYSYTKMEWSGYTAKALYTCKTNSSHTAKYDATVTSKVTKEATCEAAGIRVYTASYDGHTDTKEEKIPALGHDYRETENVKSTCTEEGHITTTCKNCKDKKTETVPKLEHEYVETENVPATCTEDGYVTSVCSNCGDEKKEVLKANGHDADLKVTKEPTCVEEGSKEGVCKNCGEKVTEKVPVTQHSYPDEWTVEKEASLSSEGLESRTCIICGKVETQTIPKKKVPVAASVCAGTAGAAAVVWYVIRKAGKTGVKTAAKQAAKKAAKKGTKKAARKATEKALKEALEPSFTDRTVVTCMAAGDFYKSLKAQKHLVVAESEYDELAYAIEENEPSLVLLDVSQKSLEKVKENIEALKGDFDEKEIEFDVSLLVSEEQMKNQKELLEEAKTTELIKDYGPVGANASVNLVKLVLPTMKPELRSDEGLENIGMVADALNIPGVSTIIDLYVNGRDIKSTIDEGKEEGLGFVDKATIISDLAAILGLDTVSSVAGLVVDVDDIKSSLEAKVGANEAATTKDAVVDIVDVVSELVD